MKSWIRQPLAAVAIALLVAWVLALAVTVTIAFENQYLRYGFTRSTIFIFQQQLTLFLLPTLAVVLVIATANWVWRVRRRARESDGSRLASVLAAVAASAVLFARLAIFHNRFRHSELWNGRIELAGLRLPEALAHWEVWRTNLLILAVTVAVFLVLWFILARLFRTSLATGVWRLLGIPLIVAVVLAVNLLPLWAAPWMRQQIADRPHVILISLDTLRGDRLGCYGYQRDTSPEMDALADEGILFEWTFSQAPNTPPSHMSIFTSLYPTVHGFYGSGDRLAGWRLTLAEYLREAGYRTFATTDGGFMRGWYGFGQGCELYDDYRKGIARSVALTEHWLDEGLADTPFFLFIHCYDVHCPYNPPQPYRDTFDDPDYDGGFNPGCGQLEEIRGRLAGDPTGGHGLSPADIAHTEALYDAGVLYTDAIIGRLVRSLRERGLLETSWLIITSDHGEEFTEHGSVLHDKLYHTVTRVPLIIRPPGPPQPGRRISEIVELVDLMPTILEIAGAEPVSDLQGASLGGFLRGEDAGGTWKNVAYSELPWAGRRRAVTTPELHVLTSLDRHELEAYDYRQDPLELSPLAERAAEEAVGEAYRNLLDWSAAQIAIAAGLPAGTKSFAIDEAARRELESLGYLQ